MFALTVLSAGCSTNQADVDTADVQNSLAEVRQSHTVSSFRPSKTPSLHRASKQPLSSSEAKVPQLSAAKPVQLVVENNNISGGGFQSDLAITADGLTLYSAADVSGVFKSTDGGKSFVNRNQGLDSLKIASVVITPDNNNIIYAGTGDKGNTGGLYRSVNGGDSWQITSAGDSAKFAGNHTSKDHPLAPGHPRSNGKLLAIDVGNNPDSFDDDIVLAGTYKNGVHIFTGGGQTRAAVVNASGFVREISSHPSIPRLAYAAIQFNDPSKNGIYRISFENPVAPISSLEYPTMQPEGLTVLGNGHVYGAIGSQGVVGYDGISWQLLNTGLSINDSKRSWTSVSGYVSKGKDIVYAGVNNTGGFKKGQNYSNIWRSKNNGKNWIPLVDAQLNVSPRVFGQPYNWWFIEQAFKQAGLGRTNSIVSSIALSTGPLKHDLSDDKIFVSGRGGIWMSANGGDLWQPAVNNMQATSNNSVTVNPDNPDQAVLLNTDYVLLESKSGFSGADLSRNKPKGSKSKGFDAIFDTKSKELILGSGSRDSNNPGGGAVFVKPTVKLGVGSSGEWIDTKLQNATSKQNGRVRAVTYGYHSGTSGISRIILAAVEGEGVFRHHNGVWTKSKGIEIGSTRRSDFVWPDRENSGLVYLLDLSSGLYRSHDSGKSWKNIWPEMSFRNKDFYRTGYITADDRDPSVLYISMQGEKMSPIGTKFKVYRMRGADKTIFKASGNPGISNIAKISNNRSISRPGPLIIGPEGKLWLAQQQDTKNKVNAGLFVMENPATDTSFIDVTTPEYRRTASSPTGIAVSGDGTVYVSQSGNGLTKLRHR